MDDKNYEDVDQFFLKAKIDDEPLSSKYLLLILIDTNDIKKVDIYT